MKKAILVTILSFAVLSCAACGNKTLDMNNYYAHSYEIKNGDTLYDLAIENKRDEDSISECIATVEQINHCSDKIIAGRYIIIPVSR